MFLHPEQKSITFGQGIFFYRYNFINQLRVKYYPGNNLAICVLYKEYSFKRLIKTYLFDIFGLICFQKQVFLIIKYLIAIPRGLTLLKSVKKKL